MGSSSDDSGEWATWIEAVKSDPETYATAKSAMGELAARVAVRQFGDRMSCGQLFRAKNDCRSA